MDNVTEEKLRRMHGDKAGRVLEQIADLGGYGTIGDGNGHISSSYAGGLDIRGALDDANTGISEAAKAKIAELAGVSNNDRERMSDPSTTVSSADKMQKSKEK